MPVSFQSYFSQMERVEGWVQPTTAVMCHALSEHQVSRGIVGNVCEIGVHHGKYFIGLCTTLLAGERGVGIDLFEHAQDENIDSSGHGNRSVFDRHVAEFLNPHQIIAIQGNSTRMTAEQILHHGAVRFFSVDGGHTEDVTLNDIRLAERSIADGGIVAVDDILSYYWTGVVGGVSKYKQAGGALVGFALIPGKLLMCHPQHATSYREFMRDQFVGALARRDAEFMGDPVDIFYALTDEQLAGWVQPQSPNTALQAENTELKRELALARDEAVRIKSSRTYRWATRASRFIPRLPK